MNTSHILLEFPWIAVGCTCPYCKTEIPEVVDYKLEDYTIPLHFKDYFHNKTDRDIKRKYNNRLIYAKKLPVLCPNPTCSGKVFLYDKDSNVAMPTSPSSDIKELLLKNRNVIYPKGNH